MHATGVMTNEEQRRAATPRSASPKPWERDTDAPMHLGIRVLWSAIAGYATTVIVIALLSALRPSVLSALGRTVTGDVTWMLDARTTHLLGVAGAIAGILLTLRRHGGGRPRSRGSQERPHDGWIH